MTPSHTNDNNNVSYTSLLGAIGKVLVEYTCVHLLPILDIVLEKFVSKNVPGNDNEDPHQLFEIIWIVISGAQSQSLFGLRLV